MKGGKIAEKAEAVFICDASSEEIRGAWEERLSDFRKDCGVSEPEMILTLESASADEALTVESSETVLNLLAALPRGVTQINSHDKSLIGAICSWTEAKSEDGVFVLSGTLRAESSRKLDGCTWRISRICRALGARAEIEQGFPAWEYNPGSEMLSILNDVFRKVTGDELGHEEVQGGIECSIFKRPGRDMITLGPYGDKVHTTEEFADLYSYDRIFEVFTQYLAAL